MPYPISYKKKETLVFKHKEEINSTELMKIFVDELNKANALSIDKTDNSLTFVGPIVDIKNRIPNLTKGKIKTEELDNKIEITVELYYYFGTIILIGLSIFAYTIFSNIIFKIAGIAVVGLVYYFYGFSGSSVFNIFFYNTLEKFRKDREIYLNE